VIHAVGPVWRGGDNDEDRLLASCYASALGLAAENALATIAFPAISTGIYGFPADRAASIAVTTVARETEAGLGALTEIIFCCFDQRTARFHEAAIDRLGRE
jgi:O-acetyl-ADP-ribose deacetylase (regulator of RNase III)